jgi:hypothetical protein
VADRAALLIAIDSFFEAAPPIPYAGSDATELHRSLPALGYDLEKCILLTGNRTTKASIESHLARLPKLIGKADSLLVLFVTRAFSHKGRGQLLCADTLVPDLPGTSLPLAELVQALSKFKCGEVTVLLDLDPLSLTGEMVPSGLDEEELSTLLANTPNMAALLACEPGTRSYESGQLRHGIWRHHLIEAFTGKSRTGTGKDGILTAAGLQAYLEDAVPKTLRRTYETPQEQHPCLLGCSIGNVVADLSSLLVDGGELLDPSRMRRIVFRSERTGRVKDLSGYRKTHSLPDRANDWARKYVNRIAGADIKSELDEVFERIREQFHYKRKDLDVAAERDGIGFIRTPEFEYTVSLSVNPANPTEVIWKREIGRLPGPEFIRASSFQAVFGSMFDRLIFEFSLPVNVAEFVDRFEDSPLEGVKVAVDSDANAAEVVLAGFAGRVTVTPDTVTIQGQSGNSVSLLEQFLTFLQKFRGLDETKALDRLDRDSRPGTH